MTDEGFRLFVLDDYQKVAHAFAEWDSLGNGSNVTFVHYRITDPDQLVDLLAVADAGGIGSILNPSGLLPYFLTVLRVTRSKLSLRRTHSELCVVPKVPARFGI